MKTIKFLASLPLLVLIAVQEGIDERARLAPKPVEKTVALPDQNDNRGMTRVMLDWLKEMGEKAHTHDNSRQSVLNAN